MTIVLFVILALLLYNYGAESAPVAADVHGTTAYISQPLQDNSTTFTAALQDQAVTKIVLLTNYTVGANGELQQRMGTYIPISRNITITGAHGTDDVLDLQFKLGVAELCATCTVTFENITVANERRGNGNTWDFFVGPSGPGEVHAAIFTQDMIRLRYACTAAIDSGAVIAAAKRTSWVPASSSGKQEFKIMDVTFQGVKYPDTLVALDFATDIPRTVQEGRGAYGGYTIRGRNSSRLCKCTVDKACLSKKSPDACVNDLIDQVLAGTIRQESSASSMLAVAIAIPTCIVAVLAVVAGFLLLHRKRRRQHHDLEKPQQEQKQPQQLDLEQVKAAELHSTQSVKSAPGSDLESGLLQGPCAPDAANLVRAPLGGGRGWEQLLCLTSPLIGSLDNEELQFGKLLGQGSFARVYRARWAGREVAVKVIEHDSDSQATIENEVQLMLSFNHPNIVRAFHVVTYVHKGTLHGSAGALSNGMLHCTQSGTCSAHDCTSLPLGQEHIGSSQSEGQTSNGQSLAKQGLAGSQSTVPTAAGAAVMENGYSGTAAANATGSGQQVSNNSRTNVARFQQESAAEVQAQQQQHQTQQHTVGSLGHGSTGAAAAATDNEAAEKGIALCSGVTPSSSKASSFERRGLAVTKQQNRCETWLVQEYCDCGTLSNIASEWIPDEDCDEQMLERLLLLQDAAQGLKMLHSKNVVHGDLNSRNVLVSSNPVAQFGMVAKLADLGLSRTIKQHQTHRTTQTVGTMSHMPPELLRYGRMSPAVDVYAFGIMMWELFTGHMAFRMLHYGQFFETVVLRNLRPLVPPGMPADYQLLMERCWAADPADRPNIDRVLDCLHIMIQVRRRRLLLDCSTPTAEHCTSQPLPTLQQQGNQRDSWRPLPCQMHSCPNAECDSHSGDSLSHAAGSPGDPGSLHSGASSSQVHSFEMPAPFAGAPGGVSGSGAALEASATAAPERSASGSGQSIPAPAGAQ